MDNMIMIASYLSILQAMMQSKKWAHVRASIAVHRLDIWDSRLASLVPRSPLWFEQRHRSLILFGTCNKSTENMIDHLHFWWMKRKRKIVHRRHRVCTRLLTHANSAAYVTTRCFSTTFRKFTPSVENFGDAYQKLLLIINDNSIKLKSSIQS